MKKQLRWWEHPIPHRWHRCKAVQVGWVGEQGLTLVERCACGAIRWDERVWLERNSRRDNK